MLCGLFFAPAANAQLAADLNNDCEVDVLDLLELLDQWGPCPAPCPADINGDGTVDVLDLVLLLNQWGAPCPVSLAGDTLPQYPHFEYVRASNSNAPVRIALDPSWLPHIVGKTCDVYVVAAKSEAEWLADPSLVPVISPTTVTFTAGMIQDNTFLLTPSGLPANAGAWIGVGYDVICDCNQNGVLDSGDYIDGLSDEAGFYSVHDVTQSGPYDVILLSSYTVPGISSGLNAQRAYYPANIAALGPRPIVIVSHGNGHNYQWYDHIGMHLASYGYIVMSHQNNTVPGVFSASTTTLEHTNAFIANQHVIGGGVFNGRLDTSRIAWFGHSRGGEGVAIAFNRVFTGGFVPVGWTLDSIKLVSSIAPTDFLQAGTTNPRHANFHLWTGGADADVNGCADCNLCQTFHLHDRATEYRQSISLYGAGHGDFHACFACSPVATGPCLIGRTVTHTIMRGYMLPLVMHYLNDNIPAKDFLWRQWERFKPIGAPTSSCVVVNLMYRDGNDTGKFVIDDYQTNPSTVISSSGGAVAFNVTNLFEGLLDDNNTSFTWLVGDPMNGMTVGGTGDTTRGVSFDFDQPRFYEYEIVPAARDFRNWAFLAFRAAQTTRHPFTNADINPLVFDVVIRDGNGVTSTINIGAYGGGVAHPYQRTGCGVGGGGWHNEFETIRIQLAAFQNNGSGINLSDIHALRFEFANPGSTMQGRIGLDDVELVPE
jgi:hypothetical protein